MMTIFLFEDKNMFKFNMIGKEEWKTVPGTDLNASTWGRIMITPHVVRSGCCGYKRVGGTPTRGQWEQGSGKGRMIYARRGHLTKKVARLVCLAFNGPPPPDKPICMHINENPMNNRPENLEWGTQKENLNAPGFIEYCHGRTGENNPYTKGRKNIFS
jgi:hypothetical protein